MITAEELAGRWKTRLFGQVELKAFDLYNKQHEFVYALERRLAFVAGIGSGKSVAGSIRAYRASQGKIGDQAIVTPNLGIVTAPTYPMLRDATLRTFLDIAGDDVQQFNKTEAIALMKNGSEIIFRSTEHPDRLRGPSISWWFGDEAALYRDNVWKIMVGRLRQHGKPGYAWLTTTPRGRNWVWRLFGQGAVDYRLVRAASRENIFLDRMIIDDWSREYTGDFALQELEGQFVAFQGLIYSEFAPDVHIQSERPSQFVRVVAGVDWGFANPGVILVFGVDGDGRMWLVAEQYARQRRVEEWADVAFQLRNIWNIDTFFCDPSEPDNIKVFNERGLKAEGADNSVQTGIQAVKNRLVVQGDGKPRLILSPDAVNTASEFDQYIWAENRHGIKDQPVKANDHAMDTMRYAVMGVDNPKIRRLTVEAKRYA